MQYRTIFRLLGILLMIFSPSMLTPLIITVVFKEYIFLPFLAAFFFTISVGSCLWYVFDCNRVELKIRDGFLLVVLFWLVICFFASIPLMLTVHTLPSFTDAIFETVSGITTTGVTVIQHLDSMPRSILFYRSQLQFLGGIGMVILAVAILPMLGVGGMQLFQAETPGPMKNNKLTPRITQTAQAIWSIYLLLTLLCAICFCLSGMTWFEALTESFGIVSTGGFSLHDGSLGYYKNELIDFFACLFMLLGGTNFALHFVAINKRSLSIYRLDEEFRFYLGLILAAGLIVSYHLIKIHPLEFNLSTIIKSFFIAISLLTTSGFELESLKNFHGFLPFLGILLMLIGGCTASTSGGVKVLRLLLIYKQSKRELSKTLHPQAIIPIKLNKKSVSDITIQSVFGFITVFLGLFIIFSLIFMWLGYEMEESFAIVSSTISNSGFGLSNLNTKFFEYDNFCKWLLIFIMLIGRLEIFSLLILFTKDYWRR